MSLPAYPKWEPAVCSDHTMGHLEKAALGLPRPRSTSWPAPSPHQCSRQVGRLTCLHLQNSTNTFFFSSKATSSKFSPTSTLTGCLSQSSGSSWLIRWGWGTGGAGSGVQGHTDPTALQSPISGRGTQPPLATSWPWELRRGVGPQVRAALHAPRRGTRTATCCRWGPRPQDCMLMCLGAVWVQPQGPPN